MLIFGLFSTSDDWPSNLSNESCPKCKKNGHQIMKKMKCLFLDYIQLLMIGWAIRAMEVAPNVKKWPLNHQKMKCLFLDYVQLLMIGLAMQVMKVTPNVK